MRSHTNRRSGHSLLAVITLVACCAFGVALLASIAHAFWPSVHHGALALVRAPLLGLVGVTTEEIKTLFDKLQSTFAEFRTANDERLKQVESKGSADAALVTKVEQANAGITTITAKISELQEKQRLIETAQARLAPSPSEANARELKDCATFMATMRDPSSRPVTPSADDLETYRAYRTALQAYLRRGKQAFNDPGIRDALQTGVAPDGGQWVTPDITGKIVEFLYLTSPVRGLADVRPIGTDTLEGYHDLDEADSGWVGETASRPETGTPAVPMPWRIPVFEQYANPKATQKQLDDSNFDVEGWLAKKVASKLARRENTAFVKGNGITQPKGFTTYTYSTVAPTASAFQVVQYLKSGANGAFPSTNPADKIVDLITLLKPELRAGAKFASTMLTLAAIRKLKDGQGRYLLMPDFSNGPLGTVAGFGVAELQDMDELATDAYSLFFANWTEAYQIVDHVVGIRVLRDPYTGKPYVSFYTTKRVGGGIVNYEAIKAMKFSA